MWRKEIIHNHESWHYKIIFRSKKSFVLQWEQTVVTTAYFHLDYFFD